MSAPAANFRILQVGKRPINHILLRLDVDEDGKYQVVCEVWITGWYYATRATFEDIDGAQFYIVSFSQAAADRFMEIARQAYRRDNPKEPKQ